MRVPIPPRLLSNRDPVAWCLEIHDLVLSKLAAGRARARMDFAREAIKACLVSSEELLRRAPPDLPLAQSALASVLKSLRALVEAGPNR